MRGKSLFLGICLLSSVQGWALESTYQKADPVSALMSEALHALPPLIHQRTKEDRLSVRLVAAPAAQVARLDEKEQVIHLNRAILGGDSGAKFGVQRQSLHRLFLGAIVGELVRYYDRRGFPHSEYLESRRQCIYGAVLHQPATDPECVMIQSITRSVSDSPEFLRLSGFSAGLKESANADFDRSPDPREFNSAEDAFAVNMEFFLLDPEFQCRKPLMHRYLAQQFGMNPFSEANCRGGRYAVVQKSTPSRFSDQWENLDLSKLYQIHYLWAGPGKETFSRFGHSMFRLVFCAPNRNEVGPECLNDIYAHRVISFRAGIDEVEINSVKGMTGEYPSYLYFLTFSDVVNEYTRTELRKLYSLPLQLSAEEMKRLVLAAIEKHWAYKGKYKFLENNCATETWNLLQQALVDRPKILSHSVIRPDSLYHLLVGMGLANSSYSLDRIGRDFPQLVFRTQRRLLEKNLNVLRSFGALPRALKLEEYQKLSVFERSRIGAILRDAPKSPEAKRALYAYLNLAEYSLDAFMLETSRSHIKGFFEALSKSSQQGSLDQTQLAALLKSMVSPKQLISLKESYGIPTEAELQNIHQEEIESRFSEVKGLIVKLMASFREYLPRQVREQLEQEEANIVAARTALSKIR